MSLHQELIKLCGEPDLTVLLKASVSTRISRIHNCNGQDKDLSNCAMYDDGYDKMEQFLKNSGFNYIVIDTEHLSPEEIANLVQDEVRKLFERVKFGIRRMINDGRIIDGNLTGYYRKNGRMIINEEEKNYNRNIV